MKGFTLIELLVVVLIIGILAAVALPKYQVAVAKARAAEALVVLGALERARDVYYLANGAWPESLEDLDISVPPSSNYRYVYRVSGYCFEAHEIRSQSGFWFEWYPPLAGDDKRKHCIVNEESGPQYKQVCSSLGYTEPSNRIGQNQYYKLTK